MDGEPHGSFIQGLLYGAIFPLCFILLFLPDLSFKTMWRVANYDDYISCYKVGGRGAVCQFTFPEMVDVEKIYCESKAGSFVCEMSVSDDFETPGALKALWD